MSIFRKIRVDICNFVFIAAVNDTAICCLRHRVIDTGNKLSPVSLIVAGSVVDIDDYALSRILICSMIPVINLLLVTMTPMDKYQPFYTLK